MLGTQPSQLRMKYYILLLTVAIAAPITDAVPQAGPFSNIIVGGKVAKDGEFPYAIAIICYGTYLCGGSILNEEWILTAGHCVTDYPAAYMSIVAGSNYLTNGGISHNVSFTIVHENYTKIDEIQTYDIALVKLSTPLVFTPKIQPVSLQTSPVPADSHLVLSGWGFTRHTNRILSEQLLYLETASIDLEDCKRRFHTLNSLNKQIKPIKVDETMLCGVQEYGRGACPGDSGSPLVFNGSVAGVTSWGLIPCGVGYPDAYNNVPLFVDWIQEQINKK